MSELRLGCMENTIPLSGAMMQGAKDEAGGNTLLSSSALAVALRPAILSSHLFPHRCGPIEVLNRFFRGYGFFTID